MKPFASVAVVTDRDETSKMNQGKRSRLIVDTLVSNRTPCSVVENLGHTKHMLS